MKQANQSSVYDHKTASLAVDGIITSGDDGQFSHTLEGANQWWRVDLGKVYVIDTIKIYNRESHGEWHCCSTHSKLCVRYVYVLYNNVLSLSVEAYMLQKVSLLASVADTPADPQLLETLTSPRRSSQRFSDPWTEIDYQETQYDDYETVKDLQWPIPMRHLAVFSSHTEGVTLREVQVFGRCKYIFCGSIVHHHVTASFCKLLRYPDIHLKRTSLGTRSKNGSLFYLHRILIEQ